jgi:hypothetical protein
MIYSASSIGFIAEMHIEVKMKKIRLLFAFLTLSLTSTVYGVGAIALSDDGEDYWGLYTGADSIDEAKREAKKLCAEAGGKGCKARVWFEKCGAIATSEEYYGIGYGKSRLIAEKKALEDCDDKCEVATSECE